MNKSKKIMHSLAFTTIVLWSVANVATRMALEYYSGDSLSFLRYATAAITLFIFAIIRHTKLPDTKDIPIFFIAGSIGFGLFVYTYNLGANLIEASTISLVLSITPIITVILAQLFLKEKTGIIGWVSLICAFIGVAIITLSKNSIDISTGAFFIVLASFCMSIFNIFQRKLLKKYKAIDIITYTIISGAISLTIFAPKAIVEFRNAPLNQLITVIILGVFSTAIAYVFWAVALSKADKTNEVVKYMYLTPVITTILGYFIINEIPSINTYIGGAIILLSVLIVNIKRRE